MHRVLGTDIETPVVEYAAGLAFSDRWSDKEFRCLSPKPY